MIYHDTFNGKECLRIPSGFQTAKHIEDIVALTRDLLAEDPLSAHQASPPFSVSAQSLTSEFNVHCG